MNVENIKAAIGTNSWGSAAYQTLLRGSVADEDAIKETISKAYALDMAVFDTAQDYGLGKCQPMLGRLCGADAILSAKYTPSGRDTSEGRVRLSLEKDLTEMRRDFVDIYWLHLPNDIDENIGEMAALYREGKIKNIGISNFTLEECQHVKALLDKEGIPLYGVQNHYSLINRDWEKDGLVEWCCENGVSFWAWAVLEEGLLTGPRKVNEKWTIMKGLYGRKRHRLYRLFAVMQRIGRRHGLTIAQVATAFVSSKGIVPVCGCRRAQQVQALYQAVNTTLSPDEIALLEQTADELDVRFFGKDIFRFAVKKK